MEVGLFTKQHCLWLQILAMREDAGQLIGSNLTNDESVISILDWFPNFTEILQLRLVQTP